MNKEKLAHEIRMKTKMTWTGVYEFLGALGNETENGLPVAQWEGAWLKSPAYSFHIKLSQEAAVLLKSIQKYA